MKHPPTVKSFLIADQVFRQQEGGKWCVIGIFDKITARQYPCYHPSLGLHLQLADAEGELDLNVEFHDSSGKLISRMGGIRVSFPSRLMEGSIGFQTHHLPIPAPGTYFFHVLFDNQLTATNIRLQADLAGGSS